MRNLILEYYRDFMIVIRLIYLPIRYSFLARMSGISALSVYVENTKEAAGAMRSDDPVCGPQDVIEMASGRWTCCRRCLPTMWRSRQACRTGALRHGGRGHDWGGAFALDWAARYPERVLRIAFLESIVKPMGWTNCRGRRGRGARRSAAPRAVNLTSTEA
jgi:hypothetical protein